MRSFEIEHTVTFSETNLVGNVYFSEFVAWKGKCRELFLAHHAPGVIQMLEGGLMLATTKTQCEYYAELVAFDRVCIRMHLVEITPNRVTMGFEYIRKKGEDREELVARGQQQIATMRRTSKEVEPTPLPDALRLALEPFQRQATAV